MTLMEKITHAIQNALRIKIADSLENSRLIKPNPQFYVMIVMEPTTEFEASWSGHYVYDPAELWIKQE